MADLSKAWIGYCMAAGIVYVALGYILFYVFVIMPVDNRLMPNTGALLYDISCVAMLILMPGSPILALLGFRLLLSSHNNDPVPRIGKLAIGSIVVALTAVMILCFLAIQYPLGGR